MDIIFNQNIEHKDKVFEAPFFVTWKNKIINNFNVEKIIIHKVFMFGERVGFIVAEAVAKYNDKKVPGIVFLRGDSVSIFPVLFCEENFTFYTTLVEEPRLPVGEVKLSSPAGMLDNDTVTCAALKELREEIGPDFDIKEDDLIKLGSFPLSPGGSDENIHLYYFVKNVTKQTLDNINNRQRGIESEHEQIVVKIVTLDSIIGMENIDAKTMLSYLMFKENCYEGGENFLPYKKGKHFSYSLKEGLVTISYKKDGKLHNEHGPATMNEDGNKIYCLNGKYHRIDGPAVFFGNGNYFWYINNFMIDDIVINNWLTENNIPLDYKTWSNEDKMMFALHWSDYNG